MLEVEDELGRVKEDRRQASIQVKIYLITTKLIFDSVLLTPFVSLQCASQYSVFPLIFRHEDSRLFKTWLAFYIALSSPVFPKRFCVYFAWFSVACICVRISS